MKKKGMNIMLASILILAITPLISATIVSFSFNIEQNATIEHPGIIYTDQVVFQVSTNKDALCRYSGTSGTPFNTMQGAFDDNLEIIHKKAFTSISDGVYRYYVKCREINQINNQSQGQAELEAVFRISNPIAADISMETTTLNTGQYTIDLTTTKIPINTPSLSYTYDGNTYKPILLTGSGNNWQGTLVIPESSLEAIGTFKFEGRDLENRPGTKITGDTSFEVDTIAPPLPATVEAKGEYGQIRLEWIETTQDIERIRIYRSETAPVKLTSIYKTTEANKEYYIDTNVAGGKTYYYRIAFEDGSGNIGQLSRELTGTVLLSNSSTTSTTLSAELIPQVDLALTEVSLLRSEIERSQTTFSSVSGEENEILSQLSVTSSISSSKATLDAIKRELEGLKNQNLQRSVLEAKLSSIQSRINIVKKAVPESFIISHLSTTEQKITEESIRKGMLEKSPELAPQDIDKNVKEIQKILEENDMKITLVANIVELIYLDGSKNSITLMTHNIKKASELPLGTLLILTLPQGIIEGTRISMITADFTEEKEGIYTFDADTEKIIYSLDKKFSKETVKETSINPYLLSEESSFLTGYFISELSGSGSIGAVFLIIISSSLVVYLIYIKRKSKNQFVPAFIDKAKRVKELKKAGHLEESNRLYTQLKSEYLTLSDEEKSQVFKEVKHLITTK